MFADLKAAAGTGFRTSELASMTPESFDLDGDTPTTTVHAACTKYRREVVQPLGSVLLCLFLPLHYSLYQLAQNIREAFDLNIRIGDSVRYGVWWQQ